MILLNEGSEKNEEKNDDSRTDSVQDGMTIVRAGRSAFAVITVIGQIEGHYKLPQDNKTTCYEHLIPMIVAAECSDKTDGILVILNTVGGDVEAGLALAELLAGVKKPVVSLVLGGAHSIGIPLAAAADVSLVAKSATLTVHPVRTNGLTLAAKQSFDILHDMQERIIEFVCGHSRITAQRFRELMLNSGALTTDMGTVLGGEDAVKEGLLDKVATLSEAIDELEKLIIMRKRD